MKTGAYEELAFNPFEESLIKVTSFLIHLHTKTKDISKKPFEKMITTRKDVRLAHMYFNPKTHKVSKQWLTLFDLN